jgi:hypothetical protein
VIENITPKKDLMGSIAPVKNSERDSESNAIHRGKRGDKQADQASPSHSVSS